MHHLFLGYDPTTLGVALLLIEDKAIDIPANDLFINANLATPFMFFPA